MTAAKSKQPPTWVSDVAFASPAARRGRPGLDNDPPMPTRLESHLNITVSLTVSAGPTDPAGQVSARPAGRCPI